MTKINSLLLTTRHTAEHPGIIVALSALYKWKREGGRVGGPVNMSVEVGGLGGSCQPETSGRETSENNGLIFRTINGNGSRRGRKGIV